MSTIGYLNLIIEGFIVEAGYSKDRIMIIHVYYSLGIALNS